MKQLLTTLALSLSFGCSSAQSTSQNTVRKTPATPIVPPYELNVADEAERNLYTILDADKDGKTWGSTRYDFRCETSGANASDDWLFSPAVTLEAGKSYAVSFAGRNKSSDKPEIVSLKAGAKMTPEDMTSVIFDKVEFVDVELHKYSTYFVPAASGNYYFGFHCTSAPEMYYMCIENFAIQAPVDPQSPDSVSGFRVVPAPKGALQAALSFVTPTKNVDGSALTALTKVVVTNVTAGKVLATLTDVAVGKTCEVTDDRPVNGFNEYRVVCHAANGEGKSISRTAYVGIDVPRRLSRGDWKQNGPDVVITWKAVSETGVNGGYVDPDGVSYRILRLPEYEEVAKGIKDTTFTDTSLNDLKGQRFLYYAVVPSNVAGTGMGQPTFSGPFGTPCEGRIKESFPNAGLTYNPWFLIKNDGEDKAYWDIVAAGTSPVLQPQDNDGGMAVMLTGSYGDCTMASPLFAISAEGAVNLSFYASHSDRRNNLRLMISDDACHTWKEMETIPATVGGWHEYTYDITRYAGKIICLGFRAAVEEDAGQIAVDNVRIDQISSGVESRLAGAAFVEVLKGGLAFRCLTQNADVFAVDGGKVAHVDVRNGASQTIGLPAGVYVVGIGGNNIKVVVRR